MKKTILITLLLTLTALIAVYAITGAFAGGQFTNAHLV